jgi:hypothetical protein
MSTSRSQNNENNNDVDEAELSDSSSDQSSVTNTKSSEFNRLESYPWQWPHTIAKRDLAKNGFFYIEEKQCSQCYYCDGQLSSETIEAMNEHRANQKCVLAREEDIRNKPLINTHDYR